MRTHLLDNSEVVSSLLVVFSVVGLALIHRGTIRQRRQRPVRAEAQAQVARRLWFTLAAAAVAEQERSAPSSIELTPPVDLRADSADFGKGADRADRAGDGGDRTDSLLGKGADRGDRAGDGGDRTDSLPAHRRAR